MKKILISLTAMASLLAADGCGLTQSNDINVTWKAYKTLAKLGVGGAFTDVNYTAVSNQGKRLNKLLVGSKVSIDITKIDTKNPKRDKTLVKNFFKQLKGKEINGTVTAMSETMIDVNITMNEKSVVVPMRYHFEKEQFKATGTIDLFDFTANDALASINKSCFDLHKGKTWNDVTIGFSLPIHGSECDVEK